VSPRCKRRGREEEGEYSLRKKKAAIAERLNEKPNATDKPARAEEGDVLGSSGLDEKETSASRKKRGRDRKRRLSVRREKSEGGWTRRHGLREKREQHWH